MKTCSKCGVSKALEEFYPDQSKKDGRHTVCKECVKADRRARYAENPDKYLTRMKDWNQRNKGYLAEKRKREREELIAEYGGCCACCGEDKYEFLTIDQRGRRWSRAPQGHW